MVNIPPSDLVNAFGSQKRKNPIEEGVSTSNKKARTRARCVAGFYLSIVPMTRLFLKVILVENVIGASKRSSLIFLVRPYLTHLCVFDILSAIDRYPVPIA